MDALRFCEKLKSTARIWICKMHLIIAEKHDAAKRIAQILAGTKPRSQRVAGVEAFRLDDKVVLGLSGHIVGVDYPPGYNNWQKVDCKDLIRAEIVVRPLQEKIISALRALGAQADRITIATDYDREGELIGVEALKIAREANPILKADRVRYSAIVKDEILKAFQNSGSVDFDLAASGEARQIIDLVWGAVLTRYISLTSGKLGKEFLSVGRVQSPTLALIVDREREIQAFQPQPYWEIYADLEKELRVQHAKGRIWEKAEVDRIIANLGPEGTVLSIETKPRVDKPPAPFDTTSFIAAASGIGFLPQMPCALRNGSTPTGSSPIPGRTTPLTRLPSTCGLLSRSLPAAPLQRRRRDCCRERWCPPAEKGRRPTILPFIQQLLRRRAI